MPPIPSSIFARYLPLLESIPKERGLLSSIVNKLLSPTHESLLMDVPRLGTLNPQDRMLMLTGNSLGVEIPPSFRNDISPVMMHNHTVVNSWAPSTADLNTAIRHNTNLFDIFYPISNDAYFLRSAPIKNPDAWRYLSLQRPGGFASMPEGEGLGVNKFLLRDFFSRPSSFADSLKQIRYKEPDPSLFQSNFGGLGLNYQWNKPITEHPLVGEWIDFLNKI